jgi:serine/threonine-protein kinase RsbT
LSCEVAMHNSSPIEEHEFKIKGGDFTHAGEASLKIKKILKRAGIPGLTIRRAAIACFEAEMNVVMYAREGVIRLTIGQRRLKVEIEDHGPGIMNIQEALREGFTTSTSDLRDMGFGAGMGLANIKRNTSNFSIESSPGLGTVLWFDLMYEEEEKNETE